MAHVLAKGFVLEKRNFDLRESEYFIMNVIIPNFCSKGLHYLHLQAYKQMSPWLLREILSSKTVHYMNVLE